MQTSSQMLLNELNQFVVTVFLVAAVVLLVALFLILLSILIKNAKRERYALDFVTLLVKLPKANEIKIDAAEQMFTGLYSLKKGGLFFFF